MKSDLNKPEVINLIRDLGLEGYGLYKIIKKNLSPKKMNISVRIEILLKLAEQYGVSEFKAFTVITGYGLFDVNYSITDGKMVSLKKSKES